MVEVGFHAVPLAGERSDLSRNGSDACDPATGTGAGRRSLRGRFSKVQSGKMGPDPRSFETLKGGLNK